MRFVHKQIAVFCWLTWTTFTTRTHKVHSDQGYCAAFWDGNGWFQRDRFQCSNKIFHCGLRVEEMSISTLKASQLKIIASGKNHKVRLDKQINVETDARIPVDTKCTQVLYDLLCVVGRTLWLYFMVRVYIFVSFERYLENTGCSAIWIFWCINIPLNGVN